MPRPRAVLLDVWDTLARVDWPSVRAGRSRLAERAGADPEALNRLLDATVDQRSRGAFGPPEAELGRLLAECGAGADGAVLAELVAMEDGTWRRGTSPFPDVLDGLRRLRAAGCRLALVSNCSWQTRPALEAMGLDRLVDAAVLSFEAGVMKPEPAILDLALERLGVGPADAALVDDIAAYLDVARDRGLGTVLMDRRGARPDVGHPVAGDLPGAAALLGA